MKPTVMVAVSIAPNLEYCWHEVLDAIALLGYPPESLSAHLVSHGAFQALSDWILWSARQPFRTSSELYNALPHGARSSEAGGYDGEVTQTIMHVQEQVRRAFLASDAEWCFMLECDQIPPVETLEVLLEADKPLVMAATPARHKPTHMNACRGGYFDGTLACLPLSCFPDDALFQMDSVGTGCTLIHRDLLATVGWEDPAALSAKYHGNGGDVAFCAEVYERLGVKPFVSTWVKVQHVGRSGKVNRYYAA